MWWAAVAVILAAAALTARTGFAAPAPSPVPAPAPAETIPEVSLDLQRCARLPRAEIVRLVGQELDARVVPPGSGGPHATRGVIACGATGIRLEVSDPLAGTFLSRTLPARPSDASAAPRIAALALAELVFASWLELAQPRRQAETADAPPHELQRAALERAQRHASAPAAAAAAPAPAPATERPPAEMEPAAPRSAIPTVAASVPEAAPATTAAADLRPDRSLPDRTYVLAVGQATGPFRGVGLAWGGGVRLGRTAGATLFTIATAPVGLAGDLDLTATWTDVDSSAGSVRVSSWSAAPRAGLRLNLGSRRNGWVDGGVGARLGVARLVAAPVDPTSFRGGSLAATWGGVTAHAGVGLLIGSLVVAAGLEGGQVLRTVSGTIDGQSSVSIAGRWLSASVALGWGR